MGRDRRFPQPLRGNGVTVTTAATLKPGTTTGPSAPLAVNVVEVSTPKALLLLGSFVISGVLTGTASSAPVVPSPVRYTGDWTSTARPLDESPMPSRRWPDREVDAAAPSSPESNGITGVNSSVDHIGAVTAETQSEPADRDLVRWLHDNSGLTWEQLGRLFGVSRRAVHLWASGGRMNASNATTLHELAATVRSLPGDTPNERRAGLLRVQSDGASIVDLFRSRHAASAAPDKAAPPERLLGALHDRPQPGT